MDCYLDKSSVDFYFICLSIICTIVLSTFIYFTTQLHYLLPHQLLIPPHLLYRHRPTYVVVFISLSDFVYMHFDAFIISFIKC